MLMALTESGEREADDGAEGGPHVPAVLEGGHRVHRDPEHGDQQLAADQVHQQQVELCPKLGMFFCLFFFIWVISRPCVRANKGKSAIKQEHK